MKELIVKKINGVYHCDFQGLQPTSEEWKKVFLTFTEKGRRMLIEWYYLPNHTGQCEDTARLYVRTTAKAYNGCVVHVGKKVISYVGRFETKRECGETIYWIIPFEGWEGESKSTKSKKGFVWKLREELVEAMAELEKEGIISCEGRCL